MSNMSVDQEGEVMNVSELVLKLQEFQDKCLDRGIDPARFEVVIGDGVPIEGIDRVPYNERLSIRI